MIILLQQWWFHKCCNLQLLLGKKKDHSFVQSLSGDANIKTHREEFLSPSLNNICSGVVCTAAAELHPPLPTVCPLVSLYIARFRVDSQLVTSCDWADLIQDWMPRENSCVCGTERKKERRKKKKRLQERDKDRVRDILSTLDLSHLHYGLTGLYLIRKCH